MPKRQAESKAPLSRKQLVADSVLKCAVRLFGEKGFASTSLQDVAEALGVSRSSIYHYYSSKEEILDALVEGVSIASIELVRLPATADAALYGEALRADVRAVCLHIARNSDIYRVLYASEGQLPASAARRFREGKRKVFERLARLIEGGIKAGAFREVAPEMAAAAILTMVTWVVQPVLVNVHFPQDDMTETVADMALASIAAVGASQPADMRMLIERMRRDLSAVDRFVARADKPSGGIFERRHAPQSRRPRK